LQTNADLSSFIIGEENSGLFHYAFALFNSLKRRQAGPGGVSKLSLAPAREPPRCLTRAANAGF
jgi:hypothetical protein